MSAPPPILPPPTPPLQAAASFHELMLRAARMAALVHLVFLGLFAWLEVQPMVWLNLLSILLYIGIVQLMPHRRWRVATQVAMGAEVLVHGLMAVLLVGWDSGFHIYLMLIPPVLVMSTRLPPRPKVLATLAVVGVYLAADVTLRHAQPPWPLPAAALDALHLCNVSAAMGLLSVLAGLYFRLVLRAETRLRSMAATDPLTGLLNRRSLLEGVMHWRRTLPPTGEVPACVLLIDIDHFKRVNDEHGHEVGDQALSAVAAALRQGLREGDLLARWGGEEFLVLLPGLGVNAARMVAERLRALVLASPVRVGEGGVWLPLSVSVGLAPWRPAEDFDAAVALADAALYQAKGAGRNRVQVARAAA